MVVNKIKKICNKTNRWHIVIFLFAFLHANIVPNAKLGFYCNDPALAHPYNGDTVSWKLLLLNVYFLPLVVMLIFERIFHPQNLTDEKEKRKNYVLSWYKEYVYSILWNMIIVHIMKSVVGSPRPHFFDTCRPKEALTCQGSEYVATYTCTQNSWVAQSATSFPSGHSSLGVHCGLFIAWYLHRRLTHTTEYRRSVVYIVQAVMVAAGGFCAVSRMSDHRHHWWDVLVGTIIGIMLFIYSVLNLCNNFDCPQLLAKEGCKASDNGYSHAEKNIPVTEL